MSPDTDYNRMRWASRRGLLELDLLLSPFMDECYSNLQAIDKAAYQALMAHDDQDILNWILGREALTDNSLAGITGQIRAHNASKLV